MSTPNREQIAYWNEDAGVRWVAADDFIARLEQPLLEDLMSQAAPQPGERVIDVGCGSGRSTVQLARAVGPRGQVTGIDVSKPMLERAGERLDGSALSVDLVVADAQTHPFAPEHDLVFSIFGVMFFDDPVAAFANLRRALRPGGRLVFLCWQAARRNPWVALPAMAVSQHVDLGGTDGDGPGPFALANRSEIERILDGAGFDEIAVTPTERELEVARNVDRAVNFLCRVGPLSGRLREAAPRNRERAVAAVRAVLERHADDRGVRLGGALWSVSASNAG